MKQFKNMRVWGEAVELSVDLYQLTREFPKDEQYVLVSQMRRAGISIASNIAEGAGKRSDKDKIRFYEMGLASAFELETQLVIAQRVELAKNESFKPIVARLDKIQAGLGALLNYLQKEIEKSNGSK